MCIYERYQDGLGLQQADNIDSFGFWAQEHGKYQVTPGLPAADPSLAPAHLSLGFDGYERSKINDYLGEIFVMAMTAIFIQNFVLSRFLGLCPYLGVSKKLDSALGMGLAVIFVMTLASSFTFLINRYLLMPYNMEYLQTIAFILTIAALVQFVEMVIQKYAPALYSALGVYLPLITTNCAVLGVAILNTSMFRSDGITPYNFLDAP